MFSHTSAWFLLGLAALVAAYATPALDHAIEVRQDNVSANYRLYGFVGCSNEEKNQINAAFKEKDTITGSDDVWDIKWSGPAAVDYFGYVLMFTLQLARIIY